MLSKPNGTITILTFLVFFLSVCTYSVGQGWQADSETASGGITIQNSYPRGGSRYTDSGGKDFVYAIFWTRVVNETATPLELTINFPADSVVITSSYNYFKLFLPPDTMTLGSQLVYDYGLDLKSFLDTGFHKPTMLQRTINPKDESVFYVALLTYRPYNGAVRAGFILKEQNLFYRVNMIDPALIPCGKIVFKKSGTK